MKREFQHYDKIVESDLALESQMVKMKINFDKFKSWTLNNIQTWLAFEFIPELIQRNMTNFRDINSLLRSKGKELLEYKLLSRFIEEKTLGTQSETNFRLRENKSDAPESSLRSVSVDELLYEIKDLDLDPLLYQRMLLDRYLAPCGFSIEQVRRFVLKELIQMQKSNFSNAIQVNLDSKPKHLPSAVEILLNAFVSEILEVDSYFHKVPRYKNTIFSTGLAAIIAQPSENGLFLHISPKKFTCQLHDTSLSFPKNQTGVFTLIAFVLFFITDRHKSRLRFKPDTAFANLMHRFEFR